MNFRFKSRPGKGVQCSSDPEFAFSNVPQNGKITFLFLKTGKLNFCSSKRENLNVHYACVIRESYFS